MTSSEMLRRVAVLIFYIPEGSIASIFRVTKIGAPRATRRNIPEDGVHYSHRREILKPDIGLTDWIL
jgi:hypothetical protein